MRQACLLLCAFAPLRDILIFMTPNLTAAELEPIAAELAAANRAFMAC